MVLASSARKDEFEKEKRDAMSHERGGSVSEEARTGKRFPLHLPIKLHSDAASSDAAGTTGNLSAAGVYIRPWNLKSPCPPMSPAAKKTW
jgi:hypothetical protein